MFNERTMTNGAVVRTCRSRAVGGCGDGVGTVGAGGLGGGDAVRGGAGGRHREGAWSCTGSGSTTRARDVARSATFRPTPDAAQAEIEDMAAEAFESFLADVRGLGPLHRHTPEQRKEIGAAIREFREYAAKATPERHEQDLFLGRFTSFPGKRESITLWKRMRCPLWIPAFAGMTN